MSPAICDHCDSPVSLDHDPGAICEPPDYLPLSREQRIAMTETVCKRCREIAWEREQERKMED